MRTLLLLAFLGAASIAHAQEPASPPVTLTLSQDEAQMIVQTLNQISCPTVAALKTCNAAAALVAKVQAQVLAQQH